MNPTTQERPFTAEDQARQDGFLVDWIDHKPVLLDFQAGRLSSDAGVLLVGPVDGHLGLTQAMASVLCDQRDPKRTKSSATCPSRPVAEDLFWVGIPWHASAAIPSTPISKV